MLRLGIPTASEFDYLISPLWKVREGQGPETYLYSKLTEHLTHDIVDRGGSWAMDQGTLLEDEALPWYAFTHEVEVKRVGFCTTDDGRIGCSPDGLIGEDGGLEIKCPRPENHLKYLMQGGVPKDYLAQVHGSMLVTGRPWWIFMSYCREFPPLVIKVYRDNLIQAKIKDALDQFLEEFDRSLAKIETIKAAQ